MKSSSKIAKTALATFLFGALVAGCDGRNSFSSYSNYDLKEAYSECQGGGFSAAGAQRCENVKKECQRRKKESGFRC